MGDSLTKDLINYLSKFVLEERLELLEEKINLSDGSIYIEKLQIAGKNAVTISQFLLGNKVDNKWTIS